MSREKLPSVLVVGAILVLAFCITRGIAGETGEVDEGGWCKHWIEIDGYTSSAATEESCWQSCRDHAFCMQAVFEVTGPWGTQCWLGSQNMTERPAASRNCVPSCVDHCFAKYGFNDPAPTPAPTPVPPAANEEVDDGGWCQQWQELQDYQLPVSMNHNEQWCWDACRSNAACLQAVYELHFGEFGPGCWLGGQNMTKRPVSHRSCLNCTNHCYARHGFNPNAVDPWPSPPLPPVGEQTDPWPVGDPPLPPFTDYAAMLSQGIQGRKHGFLAGNVVYYVGGHVPSWDVSSMEHETVGLTHPFHHDLRSRGYGMAQDAETGYGHDYLGWNFYKDTKVAYGSVVVDGVRYTNPKPKEMYWRPDKIIVKYVIGVARIEEVKFVAANDAVITTISSSVSVVLEFEGRSFKNDRTITSDPSCSYDTLNNAVRIVENQTIQIKPSPTSSVQGAFVYNGMTMILSGSVPFENVVTTRGDNQCHYTFQMSLAAGHEVSLAWAMSDEAALALGAVGQVLVDVQAQLEAKTGTVNDFLNYKIPYFRCPDQDVINVYYYLWSLYYMYMVNVGKGFEQYPHTATAVNNFLGLHRYDAAMQIRVGAWSSDHTAYANGNVLLWKALLPFANKQQGTIPADNMGQAWYSGLWGGLTQHIAGAWKIYEHSGDLTFLNESYSLYKALMWEAIPAWWGGEMEAPEYLGKMATKLGKAEDVPHWYKLVGLDRFSIDRWINQRWNTTKKWLNFADPTDWTGFAFMNMDNWPDEYAEAMVEKYATNNSTGFWGKIPLTTTALHHWPECPHDRNDPAYNPDCGHFMVTPDTNYYMLSAMFKHNVVGTAVASALAHLKKYNMRWGVPVAPEAYDKHLMPFGDQFSNFNAGKIVVYLEGLLGLNINVNDNGGSFEVADNCPTEWAFMEARVPVKIHNKTEWTMVRVERSEQAGQVTKTVSVLGNRLNTLRIRPWTENRTVMVEPVDATNGPRNHRGVTMSGVSSRSVTMVLVDEGDGMASSTTTKPEPSCVLEAEMKACVLHGWSFKCTMCAKSIIEEPCCSCHNGGNPSETPTLTTTALTTPKATRAPTTTTTVTTASTTPSCKPWCARNTNTWEKKCRWTGCAGCFECSTRRLGGSNGFFV